MLTRIERQLRYAYLTTLFGVVLVTITTAYTSVSQFFFGQMPRSRPPNALGNFTGGPQFGNFTGGPQQFANVGPYGGFVSNFALLAVTIAIVGVLWLGLSLSRTHILVFRRSPLRLHDKPKAE